MVLMKSKPLQTGPDFPHPARMMPSLRSFSTNHLFSIGRLEIVPPPPPFTPSISNTCRLASCKWGWLMSDPLVVAIIQQAQVESSFLFHSTGIFRQLLQLDFTFVSAQFQLIAWLRTHVDSIVLNHGLVLCWHLSLDWLCARCRVHFTTDYFSMLPVGMCDRKSFIRFYFASSFQ